MGRYVERAHAGALGVDRREARPGLAGRLGGVGGGGEDVVDEGAHEALEARRRLVLHQ